MAEKYWMQPEFKNSVGVLGEPNIEPEVMKQVLSTDQAQPSILGSKLPERYWFDATEDELRINVHQSYFDIANAGRRGGSLYEACEVEDTVSQNDSLFIPSTDRDQDEWASLVMRWDSVFLELDGVSSEAHNTANLAVNELDSIIRGLRFYRFDPGSRTPQLISPLMGSLVIGGQASKYLREFFAVRHGEADTAEVAEFMEASDIVRSIGRVLFDDDDSDAGVGVYPDGRFISNTAVCFGTGSLEVMPNESENGRGYFYSSHNIDSALTGLWAFAGLARLVGEAHRYYDRLLLEDGLDAADAG